LAVIRSARGDYANAEKIYERILARKKDNPLALYNLAVLQHRRGDYNEALENLKVYLQTAHGRNVETDEAFALIEKIKDSQIAKGGKAVTDDEIRAMAAEVQSKPKVAKAAESDTQKEVTDFPANAEDSEVQQLEKELID